MIALLIKVFLKNELLLQKFEQLKSSGGALHLMGLLSDAGIHGHDGHLYALLRLAKRVGIKKVFIHPFLDGRDVPPRSAKKYLQKLTNFCTKERFGVIASIHGRFYAMDRDTNWERTKKSYDVLCNPSAKTENMEWGDLLDQFYEKNVTDEFIPPMRLTDEGVISKGDGVLFFNFRPDRARQLAQTFLDPDFKAFFNEMRWIASRCIGKPVFDKQIAFIFYFYDSL